MKKLLLKVLLSTTKGMDEIIHEQEGIIDANEHDFDTLSGCNHAIGYATAMQVFRKEWIQLLHMNKKELKRYIKENKKIAKKNAKYLDEMFGGLLNGAYIAKPEIEYISTYVTQTSLEHHFYFPENDSILVVQNIFEKQIFFEYHKDELIGNIIRRFKYSLPDTTNDIILLESESANKIKISRQLISK